MSTGLMSEASSAGVADDGVVSSVPSYRCINKSQQHAFDAENASGHTAA